MTKCFYLIIGQQYSKNCKGIKSVDQTKMINSEQRKNSTTLLYYISRRKEGIPRPSCSELVEVLIFDFVDIDANKKKSLG